MRDITYCSRTDCRQETCSRHQRYASSDWNVSIADLNDGCYLSPKVDDDMIIEAIKRSMINASNNK